ncbi:transposase [Mariprofundus sp. EBB-1]|uniref:TniB family NTP-binding protein n=1 Tax=Mariprofundus sp. EBB-1 TaxID=2650971 RepID=UPI000EF2131C|nr:TniB family NTP-binding protein [Mariprofundus sp. EBB-1]RLL49804.1 transposase [Mariprofundus sp. EBB-1]
MTEQEKIELRTKIDNVLIMHSAFKDAVERIQACYDGALSSADPTCLAVLGESRTGKSRALEHFQNEYLQYRNAEGLTTPILRIEVPSKPTVKGMLEELLHNIGDPSFDKGTESSKTIRLRKLMAESGTKMLILDEFQHFIDQASHNIQHHVADWLKILVDKTRVGLVVAGLPNCINVILSNDQLTRRFMAPQYFKRFDWTIVEERNEFRNILFTLQEDLSPFDFPDLDSDDMSFRMYIASGGLIGYVIKILREATSIAVYAGTHSIDLEMIHKAQQRAILNVSQHAPAPFSRKFILCPSKETVEEAMKLGVCEPEPPKKRSRAKKNFSNLNMALNKSY